MSEGPHERCLCVLKAAPPEKNVTKKAGSGGAEKTVAFDTGTPMHLYAQDFDEREDFDNQLALHPSLLAVSWMDWGWEWQEVGNLKKTRGFDGFGVGLIKVSGKLPKVDGEDVKVPWLNTGCFYTFQWRRPWTCVAWENRPSWEQAPYLSFHNHLWALFITSWFSESPSSKPVLLTPSAITPP